jgi:D-glycero-alpha-D-manno-heptose-7-phosphate kinase
LAGGGTDVSPYSDLYGGLVLNATIDRYCYATIEDNLGGVVEFRAADLGLVNFFNFDGAHEGDLALHAAVYRRLCMEFELGSPSITLTTISDVPHGSGLGSSSTLVVTMVEAFREFFSLPLGEYDVARLAVEIERVDCGLQGGRQDQYAATFGGFNVMEFGTDGRVIVNPLRLKDAIVREFEASMVLYYTGVSRESAHIIEQQTAHIKAGQPDRISATHALKDEAIAMKEALLTGDLLGLASVMQDGWHAKKQLAAGITNSHIDEVFAQAEEAGALAGKVSGAGGGGFILFLVDPMARPTVVSALDSTIEGSVHPVHFVSEGAVAWSVR